MTEWIASDCRQCGVTFQQPYDPGRRREFCSNACRQKAYRARGGRASGTHRASARQQREWQEAWAREEARKEQERQRAKARRGRGEKTPSGMPTWVFRQARDSAEQEKRRRRCYLLFTRALHEGTDEHEAQACRDAAERIRARYGL